MLRNDGTQACIVGIGASRFGRRLPESQLGLGAVAFKAALADSGLSRDDVDGLSINLGAPLGLDYDQVAQAFGLDVRYVNQSWMHGRFVTHSLQHAALAVEAGLADVVACVTAISFTRALPVLGGVDSEDNREAGGTHGESPPYGLTAPSSGAALGMQRYMHVHGATSEQLAAVPIAFRKHAGLNPNALMRVPMTVEDHQASRFIVEPLHLLDCCLVTDGAVVVLVTSADRAKDLEQRPVTIAGMQGLRTGREEFIFSPRGMGLSQQTFGRKPAREKDMQVYRDSGVDRTDVQGLYTYDAFSPLVLFTLERFGFCGPGEAAAFVQGGTIELGGKLPMNTSGGLLSEAHVGGWNSIAEMVRQLRGTAGPSQIPAACCLQWGTVWGDSVILRN
jgi:acetyl-CoA acetyltransferase